MTDLQSFDPDAIAAGSPVAAAILVAVDNLAAKLSSELRQLGTGDAIPERGAIEGHAEHLREGIDSIAAAGDAICNAVYELSFRHEQLAESADRIAEGLFAIAEALDERRR